MAYIYYLTHIHLGYDALAQLPAECARLGIRRPLLVTDKGVVAAGLAQRVLDALDMGAFPCSTRRPPTRPRPWSWPPRPAIANRRATG